MRGQSMGAAEARRVALAAQGFDRARPPVVGTRQLNVALARMGVLQIDSVNVFARSHYMPLFSRLGVYDPALLDRLLFSRRPSYAESWAHVAAFIPAADWGLLQFRRDDHRAAYSDPPDSWMARHRSVVDGVKAELARRGPLRPAQLERAASASARGPWWDWDAVKTSLEHLWRIGEVAIDGRRGFERRYGLAEDVLPATVLAAPVARDDAIRELIRRAARASGVATASDLADYFRIKDRARVIASIRDLEDTGELLPVTVDGWTSAGRPAKAWLHRDAAIPRRLDAAALLTPFDPVVWFRDRAERLFGFTYRIEIYTPAPLRRHGYYSLPVLVGDDLVGRVDLKADRAASTLRVQSAWWEEHRPPDAASRLAAELEQAARWRGLEHITVSRWGDATDALAAALPRAGRH